VTKQVDETELLLQSTVGASIVAPDVNAIAWIDV